MIHRSWSWMFPAQNCIVSYVYVCRFVLVGNNSVLTWNRYVSTLNRVVLMGNNFVLTWNCSVLRLNRLALIVDHFVLTWNCFVSRLSRLVLTRNRFVSIWIPVYCSEREIVKINSVSEFVSVSCRCVLLIQCYYRRKPKLN